ncbi:MAG: branched-chain amino acid transport system ATP-binding protein [Actinomycetota bacterium]|nr:branched-chain amino acid transport system ATP-binding protein [Actinomycetota bacterium]
MSPDIRLDPGAYDGSGLRAEDVVVRFGGLVALGGVTVEAPRGRITGLIGPNGAGKTTMFNVCCGFQKADEGTVTLDGKDISHESPARRARLGIGRTFQRMELFGSLTVRENVELAAEAAHVGDDPLTQLGIVGGRGKVRKEVKAIADELICDTGLEHIYDRLASEISAGQGRLVELARALARGPNLLLLDEPSSGLDAAESAEFAQLLVRLVQDRDLGILMVEHDMSLVLTICQWIHVLDFGKPLMNGTPEQVRTSEEVRAAYLGQEGAA